MGGDVKIPTFPLSLRLTYDNVLPVDFIEEIEYHLIIDRTKRTNEKERIMATAFASYTEAPYQNSNNLDYAYLSAREAYDWQRLLQLGGMVEQSILVPHPIRPEGGMGRVVRILFIERSGEDTFVAFENSAGAPGASYVIDGDEMVFWDWREEPKPFPSMWSASRNWMSHELDMDRWGFRAEFKLWDYENRDGTKDPFNWFLRVELSADYDNSYGRIGVVPKVEISQGGWGMTGWREWKRVTEVGAHACVLAEELERRMKVHALELNRAYLASEDGVKAIERYNRIATLDGRPTITAEDAVNGTYHY